MVLKERLPTLVEPPPLCFDTLLILGDTEGTFRPERIMEIAERFGGKISVYLVLIDAYSPS